MSNETYKAMGVNPVNLSPVGREPMLSDAEMVYMVGAVAVGSDGSKHVIGNASDYWQAKAVRDFYEDKITGGDLMVVKTVNESSIPRYRGDQHMPCCGHMIDCVESFPPEVGQHCVCGAKIVEG